MLPFGGYRSDAHFMLSEFVDRSVFLHDDWNPVLGDPDWDQFDTVPMLLGAKRCVMHEPLGFGPIYQDYLASLNSLPELIISPNRKSKSTTIDLLDDPDALNRLKATIDLTRCNLSTFYAYPEHRLGDLISRLGDDIVCNPSARLFGIYNDRLNLRPILERARIPIPISRICYDNKEIYGFMQEVRRLDFSEVVIKEHHRKMRSIRSDCSEGEIPALGSYPVLVEAVYEVICSPVVHLVKSGSRCEILFTIGQRINNFHFEGNYSPVAIYPEWATLIKECSSRISDLLTGFDGVFGIDFIITPDGQVIVVDVNPRFNSSTYPFFFLERMGISADHRYCEYGFVTDVELTDLSELVSDRSFPSFNPAAGDGVFVFNPVYNLASRTVVKWSYIATAQSEVRLAYLTSQIRQLGARFS